MRFNDLNITKSNREVWKLNKDGIKQPMNFADVMGREDKFKTLKTRLKDDLSNSIFKHIDDAENEEQIGARLDPVFEQLSKSFFVSNEPDPELLLSKANKNTLTKKLQSWCEQLNTNVKVVKKTPGVKIFFNKLKNVPCVIVCAGPNLGNSLPLLSTLKNKAVIMSVDTSFRSCIKRNIIPDFCNAHDANENGQKFFNNAYAKDTVSIFVNYIHPKTIASYNGPKTFYYVDDPSIQSYFTMALACDDSSRPDGSFLESAITGGSCVAHTALYAALRMGCNPITFVGLDLSYPDLTKTHFESDNMKKVTGQRLIDVVGINGKNVKTNLSFYSYKVVFDKMAPMLSMIHNVDLYTSTQNNDGSPAGIVHSGLTPMPFQEWVDKFANVERDEIKQILSIYKKYCPI